MFKRCGHTRGQTLIIYKIFLWKEPGTFGNEEMSGDFDTGRPICDYDDGDDDDMTRNM
jgi:hypothetical protein